MIPKSLEKSLIAVSTASYLMSHSGYVWRGVLYFLIAVLGAATQYLSSPYKEISVCLGAGLLAVRAFIDKSPAQVDRGSGAQTAAPVDSPVDSPSASGSDGPEEPAP